MKKYISFLLLLLIMPLCFAGCGDKLSETYWIDTSKAVEEYLTSDQFLSVKNIKFDPDLESVMIQDYGKHFMELSSVYAALFNSSISYANTYYLLFQNNPQVNNKAFKNKIVNVNKKLSKFKLDVDKFLKCKENYETFMDFTDKDRAESELEKVRLLQFKQEYLNLIQSAHALSLSMLNASRVGYYEFKIEEESSEVLTQSNVRIAVYLTNAELLTTSIDMLEIYNYTDEYSEYEQHWNKAIGFYESVLQPYENNSLTITSNSNLALTKWQTYYNSYLEDKELFDNIKEKMNFERLIELNHDATRYAEDTKKPGDKNKVEYLMNFPKISQGLISYTAGLFA